MGIIQQTAQKVEFKAGQAINDVTSNISSVFNNIVGGLSTKVESLWNGDVVGINTAMIPDMQNAIQTYCDNLYEHLNQMEANATTDEAFKGAYAESISEFVGSVKTCCSYVISNLLAFSDQLSEIQTAYEQRDTAMASDISGQAEELKGSYQEYTRTK